MLVISIKLSHSQKKKHGSGISKLINLSNAFLIDLTMVILVTEGDMLPFING